MLTSFRKLFSFAIMISLLLTAFSVSAHDVPMAGSRWSFSKTGIFGEIDLKPVLFAEIKPIKAGNFDISTIPPDAFGEVARDMIQPYINERLSILVNDKKYPVKVDKLDRNANNLYTITISVNNVSFDKPVNAVKIFYSLLFDETNNEHINLACGYLTDSKGDELKKIFNTSTPAMQIAFDANTKVWEFSINRPASAPVAEREPGSPVVNSSDASILYNREHRSVWTTIREFIPIGIEHILTGYDHIAFLLALIVIGLSLKEALKIITAFTVAHSITLLLAALQIVSLESRFVESVIALSICYVAVENILKKKVNYRWLIAFVFGLVHGFGFASALQELIVGKSNLLLSVLSFNAGVEIGQLTIVCALMPVLYLLKKQFESRIITMGASVSIFIFGFTWLIERVFDLKLLWF